MPRKRKGREDWLARQIYEDDKVRAIETAWDDLDAEKASAAELEQNPSADKKETLAPLLPTASLASKERQG